MLAFVLTLVFAAKGVFECIHIDVGATLRTVDSIARILVDRVQKANFMLNDKLNQVRKHFVASACRCCCAKSQLKQASQSGPTEGQGAL